MWGIAFAYQVNFRFSHGRETEAASLTALSIAPLPKVVDWTVNAETLGEVGPSPPPFEVAVGRRWHVVAEIAVAREMGMRQRPLPCKYCMAEPMSSSISFTTWCSVTVKASLVDGAPVEVRPTAPPVPLDWLQSVPPYKKMRENVIYGWNFHIRPTFSSSF